MKLSTDFGRRAFSYSSSATWNSIPTSIKIVPLYTVSSATSSLASQPSSLTINILRPATWRLAARASDSCLMLDCVRVINFLLLLLFIIIMFYPASVYLFVCLYL